MLEVLPRTERKFKGKSLTSILQDYTILDLETTGLDPRFEEILELSAIKVRNNEVIDIFQSLVKPEHRIGDFITNLTGITNEMVKDAPKIENALPNFLRFIGDDVVVIHNAHFDVNFIYDFSLTITGTPFSNNFVDTLRLSRKLFPELKNHRLKTLADYFELTLPNHRSLDDCKAAIELYQFISNHVASNNLSLEKLFVRKKYTKASSITTEKEDFDESHPLYGKVCVFTGTLEKMSRKDAMQIVVDLGGHCADGVNKKSNYLILGNFDYSKSIKDGKSSKLKKAESLILSGQDLEIISENVFYELVDQD
ncbi:exonuclease domain-containing protein [Paenibacillus popilliae]|uniref:DNA polymerase III n=1 Tax=Paenibacillus popilliae ATCC 14706 TaxID=1212764 RepID=M9M3D6_PAEPP|nr:exonuclease domain-containing protein [Paenibacillus popilliae]GAC41688.1 DNA polymerase III [Paenibacillus popilliae ATCC 14706]